MALHKSCRFPKERLGWGCNEREGELQNHKSSREQYISNPPGVYGVEHDIVPTVVGEDDEDRLQSVPDVVEVPRGVFPFEASGLALSPPFYPVLVRAVDVVNALSVCLGDHGVRAEAEGAPPDLFVSA